MSTITNARRGAWPGPHAARHLQHLTSALMVLVLAGCGGGGDATADATDAAAANLKEPVQAGFTPDEVCTAEDGAKTGLDMPGSQAKGATSSSEAKSKGAYHWSEAAGWQRVGAKLPSADSDVVIEHGQTVILNRHVKVRSLTIVNGTLLCTNDTNHRGIGIEADYVSVRGSQARFICGEDDAKKRQTVPLTITLRGDRTDPAYRALGHGGRLLAVSHGGTLSLHGEVRKSWVKLAGDAQVDQKSLQLSEVPVGWKRGMQLVIAASGEDWRKAETVVIDSINGAHVTLTRTLKNAHSGSRPQFTNKHGKTWTVDARAVVGLLSHSITLQGPEHQLVRPKGKAPARQGAQLMVMHGGKAQVSHMTFRHVGNEGELGQYPFHWHLLRDGGRGQYIRSSAIHNSFNRCVTVHSTNGTEVSDNVCHEHVGHGYFLEAGDEQHNTLKGNVSIGAIRPHDTLAILDSDKNDNVAAAGPANFWISNPNNTITQNIAAGGDGTGFWYHLAAHNPKASTDVPLVTRSDGQRVAPRNADFGAFSGNTAHSLRMGYSSCPLTGGTAGMEPPDKTILMDAFTVYMTTHAALWPCGHEPQTFKDLMVLDAGRTGDKSAFVSPQPMFVRDALFVANSDLAERFNGAPQPRAAIGHYDQGSVFEGVFFVGYAEGKRVGKSVNSALVGHVGGAVKRYDTRMSRATFDPPTFTAFAHAVHASKSATQVGSVITDMDGSMSNGRRGWQLRPRSAVLTGDVDTNGKRNGSQPLGCVLPGTVDDDSHGVFCPNRLLEVRLIDVDLPAGNQADYALFRMEGGRTISQAFSRGDKGAAYYQAWALPGEHLGIQFEHRPGPSFHVKLAQAGRGEPIHFELRNLDPDARVSPTASSDWKHYDNWSEFMGAKGKAWFKRGDQQGASIHLRMTLADDRPGAQHGAPEWSARALLKIDCARVGGCTTTR